TIRCQTKIKPKNIALNQFWIVPTKGLAVAKQFTHPRPQLVGPADFLEDLGYDGILGVGRKQSGIDGAMSMGYHQHRAVVPRDPAMDASQTRHRGFVRGYGKRPRIRQVTPQYGSVLEVGSLAYARLACCPKTHTCSKRTNPRASGSRG